MSRLTRSQPQLWADLLTNLGGSGSALTMSEEELIAASRNTYGGGTVSALTSSRSELIASLVVASGGSASALLHNEDEMLASLATALGASNWSAATKSAVESLAEAVTLSEGGGGDEWVPDGALIHIDLVGGTPQGRAWVDGVGEVDVDTLLGTDPNTVNAWGASEYNPAFLTADGYVPESGDVLAMIGDARSQFFAGCVLRIKVKQVAGINPETTTIAMSADGNRAIGVNAGNSEHQIEPFSYNAAWLAGEDAVYTVGVGSVNATAMVITSTRVEGAANNAAYVAETPGTGDVGDPFNLVAVGFIPNQENAIQEITMFPLALAPAVEDLLPLSAVNL